MAMEWNPLTGRAMETTAAPGTAPQPAPTMHKAAVMPESYSRQARMAGNMMRDLGQMSPPGGSGFAAINEPAPMAGNMGMYYKPTPEMKAATEAKLASPEYQQKMSQMQTALQNQSGSGAAKSPEQFAYLGGSKNFDESTGRYRNEAPTIQTQPPGNASGKGGQQQQAQPQGNAYGKGGMQQANPGTQMANSAANNGLEQRMAGAMGSMGGRQQQPDMTTDMGMGGQPQTPPGLQNQIGMQQPGKGGGRMNGGSGAMGGSPMMGGYTPPNNFSNPRPSYGGGKGGQQQRPAPPPSYSGGGKGGSYQRPQRQTYRPYGGGKGG